MLQGISHISCLWLGKRRVCHEHLDPWLTCLSHPITKMRKWSLAYAAEANLHVVSAPTYSAPFLPLTMFCRLKSTPPSLFSSLNCSFHPSTRSFSSTSAIMSQVYFDVQYAPVGTSAGKLWLSLSWEMREIWRGRTRICPSTFLIPLTAMSFFLPGSIGLYGVFNSIGT